MANIEDDDDDDDKEQNTKEIEPPKRKMIATLKVGEGFQPNPQTLKLQSVLEWTQPVFHCSCMEAIWSQSSASFRTGWRTSRCAKAEQMLTTLRRMKRRGSWENTRYLLLVSERFRRNVPEAMGYLSWTGILPGLPHRGGWGRWNKLSDHWRNPH